MGKAKPQSGNEEGGGAARPASQAGCTPNQAPRNTRHFPSVQLATLFLVLCNENQITLKNKTKQTPRKQQKAQKKRITRRYKPTTKSILNSSYYFVSSPETHALSSKLW